MFHVYVPVSKLSYHVLINIALNLSLIIENTCSPRVADDRSACRCKTNLAVHRDAIARALLGRQQQRSAAWRDQYPRVCRPNYPQQSTAACSYWRCLRPTCANSMHAATTMLCGGLYVGRFIDSRKHFVNAELNALYITHIYIK